MKKKKAALCGSELELLLDRIRGVKALFVEKITVNIGQESARKKVASLLEANGFERVDLWNSPGDTVMEFERLPL